MPVTLPKVKAPVTLSPEALMNLMNAGILDPKQLSKIAKKVKKDNKSNKRTYSRRICKMC